MSRWTRLLNVLRLRRLRRDLDEEHAFHLAERTRELIGHGYAPDDAAREARRRFGNRLRVREDSLDIKLIPWLESIARDLRLGVRTNLRNAAVTAAAVVSLALALGASVAAFSLIDALILRPLPVRAPDQLVYLAYTNVDASGRPAPAESSTFNDPLFVRLRDAGRDRIDLFAMSTQVLRPMSFSGPDADQEQVRTQFVSGTAFDTLGVGPAVGRVFAAEDDRELGAHPVALISHALWQRRFGRDPNVVGRWVTLQDAPLRTRQFQIVGVTQNGFSGVEPGRPTDVWFPYVMYDPRAFGNRQFNWFRIFGRLPGDAGPEQVQSILQPVFADFRQTLPRRPGTSPEAIRRFSQVPLVLRSAENGPSPLRSEFERPLWILTSIAILVLLIAGSNVANLFLARTRARSHEMSLRLAIGAGRGRLVQQVLLETAVVAGAAALLGLFLARTAVPVIVGMLASPDDPVALDLAFDWRVAAVAAGLMLALTGLFGAAPAIGASRVAPVTSLHAATSRAGARTGLMRPFVAVQVAFSLAVLFVGSLLVTSFVRLSGIDPGFGSSNVLLLSVEPVRRVEPAVRREALLRVLDHLAQVPGVESVSSADFNLIGRAWTYGFRAPDRSSEAIETTMAPVTAEFFDTMQVPLIAGRSFSAREIAAGSSAPVIVNASFAQRYFGTVHVVGRVIVDDFDGSGTAQHEIVGVVADTRPDLREAAAPALYFPLWLRSDGTIHVRSSGAAEPLAARLRDEIRRADPMFRATVVTTQQAVVDRTLIRERLLALLSGFFSIVGLALAAVGLYGVLSYSVTQRTREIGVRVALGGSRLGVVRTVLADLGVTTVVGTGVGLAAGLYLAGFVESLLFGVRVLDAWNVVRPVAALFAVALIAAALPLFRATRVDPIVALRED